MHQRLDIVDGLRGLAIALVLLVHVGQQIAGLPEWAESLTSFGGRGVQLFFLLSALVLLNVYHGKTYPISSFYLRRWFRIAPMFYVGMLLYGLTRDATWRDWLLSGLFLHGFSVEAINKLVPGGWSIADEMVFCALFPWLMRIVHNARRAWAALAITAVLSRISYDYIPLWLAHDGASETVQHFADFNFITQLPAFMAGFVVFYTAPIPLGTLAKRGLFFISSALLVVCALAPIAALRNYLLVDIGWLYFVLSVSQLQPRLFMGRMLCHMGRVSYSIYILHFMVITWAMHLVPLALFTPLNALLCLYITTCMLSWGLATCSWRWIEQPMIRLGHRMTSHYALRAAV